MIKRIAVAAVALSIACSGAACRLGVLLGEIDPDAGIAIGIHDAGSPEDATKPDAVDAAFDVGAVPSLALWLDGDRGISPIAGGGLTWLDQSGHANHASTPTGGPTVTTTGFAGHSALAFDGTNVLVVADSPTTRFNADYTVIVVALSRERPADYAALYCKQIQPNPYTGPAMFVNFPPLDGVRSTLFGAEVDFYHYIEAPQEGTNDGVARVYEMRRTGNLLSVRVNMNPSALLTVPVTNVTSAGVDTFIGGHIPAGTPLIQALIGAIAEVIAVNGALSTSDYAGVHEYLSAKYGIF